MQLPVAISSSLHSLPFYFSPNYSKLNQMKFIFSSFVALAALISAIPRNLELQPVPQTDIDALNNLLSSVINTTNADLKKKLVDGQLDPLNKVLEGAGTSLGIH